MTQRVERPRRSKLKDRTWTFCLTCMGEAAPVNRRISHIQFSKLLVWLGPCQANCEVLKGYWILLNSRPIAIAWKQLQNTLQEFPEGRCYFYFVTIQYSSEVRMFLCAYACNTGKYLYTPKYEWINTTSILSSSCCILARNRDQQS